MAGKTSNAKRIFKFVGLVLLAGLIYAGWRFGPTVFDLWQAGILEGALSSKELRRYQGSSMDNLKAMHLALSLYHESEGQFPHSNGWMDAVQPYVQSGDMSKDEAMKKLVNPLLRPAKTGVFGYAMNDAASAKYRDDIAKPAETLLIFDSSDTTWNAHGKPEKLVPEPPRQGGNLGITI